MAQAWIGTSGFDYKEWKPIFYPADLPQTQFLSYYASQLRSVELDSTFYRMPNPQRVQAWTKTTPDNFRFTLKASRKITHFERLKLPSEALEYLSKTVLGLGVRLGALLFQLPPNFKCDQERLEAFLNALPKELPAAFEFRHESWFIDEVYRLLEKHGAALCIVDRDEGTSPIRLTCGITYLRLRRSEYPPNLRQEWQNRIRGWVNDGINVFAYIKHEDNPNAPVVAVQFAQSLTLDP